MTSKLVVYNLALGHLGERKVTSLSESREPRRVLDDFWDSATAYCLERGFWNWSMRTTELSASESYTPSFGLTYAFERPDDWVRTYVISGNAQLNPPLLDYVDEGGLWYSNSDPLYAKYVSNGTTYGMDLSLWSASFADYVSRHLANKAAKRITGSAVTDEMLRDEKRALGVARANDAMNEPPGFPPTGTWASSRGATNTIQRSRWNGTFS